MPRAADRLLPPAREPRPPRLPVAGLAVAASILVHGAALAAAFGIWGEDETAIARPIEVVMITVTRPGPAPAAEAAGAAPSPGEVERAGPPAVAMPVAEAAAPALRAPVPIAQSVSATLKTAALDREPAPATRVSAPPPPTAETAAAPQAEKAEIPPPAALSTDTIAAARIERVETGASQSPAPIPLARPRFSAPAVRASAEPSGDSSPAGVPKPSANAPASLAVLPGPSPDAGGAGTRPAEFALGSAGNPAPDYPRRARQRGWQGRVVLHVAVDRDGRPLHVAVRQSSGHGVLDDAAFRTVSTWVFRPATRAGRTVPGEAIVPVVFRLN